jgi:hypothetical protein
MIKEPTLYRIKGNSAYFKNKYGTSNPVFEPECLDTECWPGGWGAAQGNPAAMLYALRSTQDGIACGDVGKVWYGKVGTPGKMRLGELVHESEMEPLVEALTKDE